MFILAIEDDPNTMRSIDVMLRADGHSVERADRGEDAIIFAKDYQFDIILLDLSLPDISGYTVLTRLRGASVRTPVIVLSGMTGRQDMIKALELGADDYMTKPFHKEELVARINAIVRRARGHADGRLRLANLTLDMAGNMAEVGGARVHLTTKEFSILELLMVRKGQVFSRDMLIERLYSGKAEPDPKIFDIFICNIRRKLAKASGGSNYIETVFGRGYRACEPDICPPPNPCGRPKGASEKAIAEGRALDASLLGAAA